MAKEQNIAAKTGKSRWRKLQILLLIFLCTICIFCAGSYLLRSSLYLKARLTPKLAELGMKLNGEFEFDSIRAMGMTGLVLKNVRFNPNVSGMSPILFPEVTVYPDLTGMFVGDLNASLVEIRGMQASLNFESSSTPDVRWIQTVIDLAAEESRENVKTSLSDIGDKSVPPLYCYDCQVSVGLKYHSIVQMHTKVQRADILSGEKVRLSGEPIEVCAAVNDAKETCFSLRMRDIQPGKSIYVSDAELHGVEYKGVSFSSLILHGIEFSRDENWKLIRIKNGIVDGVVHEEKTFLDAMSGSYQFEFQQLEILRDKEADRIGAGIELRERSGALARIFGGYSFAEQKAALTFDTMDFDFSRFFQKADFSRKIRLDRLPISGHIQTILEFGKQRAWFDIDASVSHGAFYAASIASDPVEEFNASLAFKAWIDMQRKSFALEQVHGKIGEIPIEMSVVRELMPDGNYQFEGWLRSHGDSSKFVSSLPKGFAPLLTGYRLEGEYSILLGLLYDEGRLDELSLTTEFDLDEVKTLELDTRSNFNVMTGNAFQVRVNAASVPIVIGPREENWVTFYDLPRETAYSFIASEDGKFFSHPGFDIRAIRASLIADLKAGKIVRGGSTISQQVVKNLFLNQDKTLSRKFQEAFLTWEMEQHLTKLRIFELYLNLAHWAKDIYGIRNAAQYYFQKNVSQLTLRESLFLASILPNPIMFGGQYIEGKLSSSRLNKMINVGNALESANRLKNVNWSVEQKLIKEGKISDRPKPQKAEKRGI